jgi:hypothetical protein
MYTTHTCQKETNCAQHLPVKNNNVAQNKLPEDAILINQMTSMSINVQT